MTLTEPPNANWFYLLFHKARALSYRYSEIIGHKDFGTLFQKASALSPVDRLFADKKYIVSEYFTPIIFF